MHADITGQSRTETDTLTQSVVTRARALLDRQPDDARPVYGLHLMLGLPGALQSELGRDGHPKAGGILPDLGLERRMWGGSKIAFHAPLETGPVDIRETIGGVDEREGGSGRMAIVRLEREFRCGGTLCVSESSNIIYLGPRKDSVSAAPVDLPGSVLTEETFTPDTRMLFRFSALTYNAHRIHYDRDYARDAEGYPDLVVHGPLIAFRLMNGAHDALGREPTSFSIRLLRPAFVDRPIRLVWTQTQDGVEGLALDSEGHAHARATAS
ncbi:acyl-CoA dehydrogenase [Tepidamorphus sp. 3E244]|uniref:acyl-CoA dehydrogenase n=1 Tax=Tepidamorphus sp. 3E244 TaxID=3385498 RepID=UPI0038FCF982